MIYKFVKIQFENPTRGDWASSCLQNLEYLEIKMSLEEIQSIRMNKFRSLLRKSIKKKALEYLKLKQGSKGIEIRYSCIKMADYLLPNEDNISISDQRYIFSIRNRMVPIPYNFPVKQSEISCLCGQTENMKHIYSCNYLNVENEEITYEKIFEDNVKHQKKVYERFKQSFETREMKRNEIESNHGIPQVDPLSILYSNGNK